LNSLTDQQLLRDYAERRSEVAFSELVRRHVDLIYSAALRMVCDSHLAEDVMQGTFVALARSAPQLTERAVLSGWLHRTAQNIAAQTVRTDVRRRAREQEAAAMNELLAEETDATWTDIAPHLDAALGEMSEPDRDALLLRYFERKSAREMAGLLGLTDEAAQKRVSRAVERLRELLSKRGVTAGAGGLVILISTNAVQAAPVGISAALAASALASSAAVNSTLIQSMLIAMKLKSILILTVILVGVLLLGGGAGWYWLRHRERASNHADSTLQAGLDRFMAAVRAGDTNRLMQCVNWRVSAEVPPAAAQMVRAPLLNNLIKVEPDRANLRVVSQTEEHCALPARMAIGSPRLTSTAARRAVTVARCSWTRRNSHHNFNLGQRNLSVPLTVEHFHSSRLPASATGCRCRNGTGAAAFVWKEISRRILPGWTRCRHLLPKNLFRFQTSVAIH
jgi:RNA polymerase sigma factor (sigma-70 family)